MQLKILKYGNLMGTPDAKEMLLRTGPGSDEAHSLWNDIAGIKYAFGYNGQCTSALVLDPENTDCFPALVDPSYMTATCLETVEPLLRALSSLGISQESVRSVLVTHNHLDHYDPRVLEHLPNARAYAHPDSRIPGCQPFDPGRFGNSIMALDTPGHGGPHTSYILDLDDPLISACLAGDLIMSQAHFLAIKHPLSFTDVAQGLASIDLILRELAGRDRRYKLIFPGHGLPFFAVPPVS